MHSTRSHHSSRQNRKSRKSGARDPAEEYEEEQEKKEMHLPYWERKSYCAYKEIKVLQPSITTSIEDYIKVKIDEQERSLVGGALSLKKKLKAID